MNNRMISARGHHFLGSALDRHSIVLDFGAHLGEFSKELNNRFGCHCYAVEALPDLYRQIPTHDLIHKYNFAVGGKDGMATFYTSDNPEANSTRASNTTTATAFEIPAYCLDTFLAQQNIQTIDLLKLDIEGAEIELIEAAADRTLKACKQITIEFHDFIPGVVSHEQVQSVKKRLYSLGFSCIVFTRTKHADVLFVRPGDCGLSTWDVLYYKFIWKYLDGVRRMLTRWFS